MAVAFHPDDKHLVTGQQDGTIRFWDAHTGRPLGILGNHGKPLRAVAFSRDGRHLASASVSGDIKLWDVIRLDEQHLDGKANPRVPSMRASSPGVCLNLSFSPDSRFRQAEARDTQSESSTWKPARRPVPRFWATRRTFMPLLSVPTAGGSPQQERTAPFGFGTATPITPWSGPSTATTGWSTASSQPDSQKLYSGSNDYTVMVRDMTQLYDRRATNEHDRTKKVQP